MAANIAGHRLDDSVVKQVVLAGDSSGREVKEENKEEMFGRVGWQLKWHQASYSH